MPVAAPAAPAFYSGFLPRFIAFVAPIAGLLLAGASFDASALSKRDEAAVGKIGNDMLAAETRYREALVGIGNEDPEAIRQADAALEDMEDAISACIKQRGCSVSGLLVTYKRLLKGRADTEADLDGAEDLSEPMHPMVTAADVPEAARAAALLGEDSHAFDRMVQYNPAVQEGIRRWLTDMRGALITTYENYEYLRPQMLPQYTRAGLPEALLFGILAKESNGRVHSTSRAGASGPMQFMYTTGQRFGLGDDGTGFDTRYDPYAASEASVSYLNERMRELNRSIEFALAAYNGGEGRALRIHQANPGKDYWDDAVFSQFPPETRDYVPMVVAAAWLFLHPKQYGLDFTDARPKPAKLTLEQPATIYQLTVCLGNRGVREGYMRPLRNLNPRYEADQSLPAGTLLDASTDIVRLYKRHCVRGRRAELARRLVTGVPVETTSAPAPVAVASGIPARDYQVQRGETVTSIARKFRCDADALMTANDLQSLNAPLGDDQVLKLVGCRAP